MIVRETPPPSLALAASLPRGRLSSSAMGSPQDIAHALSYHFTDPSAPLVESFSTRCACHCPSPTAGPTCLLFIQSDFLGLDFDIRRWCAAFSFHMRGIHMGILIIPSMPMESTCLLDMSRFTEVSASASVCNLPSPSSFIWGHCAGVEKALAQSTLPSRSVAMLAQGGWFPALRIFRPWGLATLFEAWQG